MIYLKKIVKDSVKIIWHFHFFLFALMYSLFYDYHVHYSFLVFFASSSILTQLKTNTLKTLTESYEYTQCVAKKKSRSTLLCGFPAVRPLFSSNKVWQKWNDWIFFFNLRSEFSFSASKIKLLLFPF